MQVILLLINLGLISFAYSVDQVCSTFKCANPDLTNGECMKREKAGTSTTIFNYSLTSCKGANQNCPMATDTNSKCADYVMTSQVHGEFCKIGQDCSSKNCVNYRCIGLAKDATCVNTADCATGFYCKATKCTAQAKVTEACETDNDCVNSAGCNAKLCVAYYSLEKGAASTNDMFCKLGFISDNKCAELVYDAAQKTNECAAEATTCKVTIDNGASAPNTVPCLCGQVDGTKKFCNKLPTADATYLKGIETTKALLKANEGSHTLRRMVFSRTADQIKAIVDASYSFKGADQCTINQFFANSTYAAPAKFCNTYSKNSTALPTNTCVRGVVSNANFDLIKTYQVASCANKTSFYCPNIEGQDQTCVERSAGKHLDTDSCKGNDNCYSGKCENSKCVGKALNEACGTHNECAIGFSCVSTKCAAQVAVNGTCAQDFDCQNNLACNAGKCVPYFSLADGAPSTNAKLCSSNYLYNDKCDSTSLVSATGDCAVDQAKCSYKAKFANTTFELPCQCSLKYADKTFCPYPTDNADRINAITRWKTMLDHSNEHKVHTLNRFNGESDDDKKLATVFAYPKYKDVDAEVVAWLLGLSAGRATVSGFVFLLYALFF